MTPISKRRISESNKLVIKGYIPLVGNYRFYEDVAYKLGITVYSHYPRACFLRPQWFVRYKVEKPIAWVPIWYMIFRDTKLDPFNFRLLNIHDLHDPDLLRLKTDKKYQLLFLLEFLMDPFTETLSVYKLLASNFINYERNQKWHQKTKI